VSAKKSIASPYSSAVSTKQQQAVGSLGLLSLLFPLLLFLLMAIILYVYFTCFIAAAAALPFDGGRTPQTLLIHLKTDAKIAAEGMWEGGERKYCQKATKTLILFNLS
jgi:hypothetical protein